MNGPSVDVVWDPQTQMNPLESWDYSIELSCLQDLQLAAELGKTLLERNKELENIIKLQQSTVEEQAQEIEYTKKQTAALREVNDSRLKIYEQLEVSIQDLERANHRLVIENTSDKKLIKSHCITIETLEARCEELQKKIDELHEQHEIRLRQQSTSQSKNTAQTQTALWKASGTPGGNTQENATAPEEEMTELLRQLQEARNQRAREQKKAADLSQQLATLLQENTALEEQINILRSKAQDVKNLQEEINALEEVRRGHLCGRCLRGMETKTHDEISVMLDQEELDVINMAESIISDSQRDTESLTQDLNHDDSNSIDLKNPYRVLVEKYQALLEVQRRPTPRRKDSVPPMSLQEELEMSGEFNHFQNSSLEGELHQESGKSVGVNASRAKSEICGKKPFSATPTDFSEAETSSSGFQDETSNKMTQTEGRPGSFLCSIADGEDCKFSIYDDNSPFESRFRKTPEYRQTFSQIFSVLKRAAEAKEEGEKLPLLDDSTNTSVSQPQSSTLAQEDLPSETTDDNQSVVSSVVASVVSEPPYRIKTPISMNATNERQENESARPEHVKHEKTEGKKHRYHLDHLNSSGHISKKSTRKHSNRRLLHSNSPSTLDVIPTTNPTFVASKSNTNGKKKFRPFNALEQNGTVCSDFSYANKTKESPCPSRRAKVYARNNNEQHNNAFEYRDYKPSSASEEVARLKRLEMSYAEVLRLPNKSKPLRSNRRS
ncbi:cerebellar degeneration-related protein 2-like isoform X2 [Megalopta genalis]|uniref:cerebellar degeneration-related protein 2-like isoform X2 n=1 Tax=Megalopta genalis TaxID=115081 RepID=UPI00144301F2|nr:cerebellar degeneration-related protein 2 isoform X2 [Megalopta genalis]